MARSEACFLRACGALAPEMIGRSAAGWRVRLQIGTPSQALYDAQKEAPMAESEHKIRIIPLGGVDEFGKNITVVEY